MSQIIDEQKVTQQFQKQFQIKQKLRRLQGAVFKNYTVKKSISVLHPKSYSPSLLQKKNQQLFIPQINTERLNRQSFPNVAVISFGNSKEKIQSQSSRTLSLFAPRVTIRATQRTIQQKEEKLLEKMKKLQLSDLKKNYQTKSKLYENRDSQTLLRKNTLFLVNCLKTRYKQRKNAHIGERRDAANHMRLGNFSEKKISSTQYQQRFQYMEDAKQRLLKAKAEIPQTTKFSRLSPLLPQPWETSKGLY